MKLSGCEKIEIDGRISGNIIHKCLAGILKEVENKDVFISMSREELKNRVEKYAGDYIEKELGGDFGKNRSFHFELGKVIENTLMILERLQEELKATDFIPAAFEAELSKQYSLKLFSDYGDEINFGGTVDRIDTYTTEEGETYIRVIDYKSSEKKITPENLAGGINIQMLLYLFTATEEEKGMFSGGIPAGVLYSYIYPKDKDKPAGDSSFRATGLLLAKEKVLNAMEHGMTGRFIPVRRKADSNSKKGSNKKVDNPLDLSKTSKVLVESSDMTWIKDYLYNMLREMSASLHDGDVSAKPQIIGDDAPCDNCPYGNICDNSSLTDYIDNREEFKEIIEKTKEILGNQLEETGE